MSNQQIKLGQLIDPNSNPKRDAIHIAVAPVYSNHLIHPGTCLTLVKGSNNLVQPVLSEDEAAIGIADPFLKKFVNPGERFWLFLLPNTITGLRHKWTHPAFIDEAKLEEVNSDNDCATCFLGNDNDDED